MCQRVYHLDLHRKTVSLEKNEGNMQQNISLNYSSFQACSKAAKAFSGISYRVSMCYKKLQ
jgi:hypothetical protein